MPHRFLPDVALADIAFEATSDSLSGLFEACALALTDIMVDPSTLRAAKSKEVTLNAEDRERLLYDFLTELIVVKDVDSLLFKEVKVTLTKDGGALKASLRGEPIDRVRHTLRNDVKAVTMHMFSIVNTPEGWKATVVLDI
ncbi:MAG: archease [archaeon]|nr:MAG: archease [archaeon]